MTNSNSYLILYLIIILILLYAITFMSGYTCNVQTQPLDTFKSKEGFDNYYDDDEYDEDEIDKNLYFPNGVPVYPYEDFGNVQENFENSSGQQVTPNDFTLIGVAPDNTLTIQDVIGGVYSTPTPVLNSGSVIDITVMQNGSLIGVGTNNQLYSRQTINSPWVNMQITGQFNAVSVTNDGQTLILVGKDTKIYTMNLNTPSVPAQLVDNGYYVLKVIQLQNGQFLAAGTDNKLYLGNGSINPYNITWTQVQTNNCCVKSIAQIPVGSIAGIGTDNYVYVASSIGSPWGKTSTNGLIAIAVMPIPPQNINGYSRMGAFIDDSSRVIPNFIGNYNTLPECISAAKSQGYNTAGYQFMTQCFGGNNSSYDKLGLQTDNTKTVAAYPGSWTNIVYKTGSELEMALEPNEGEVFVYTGCQFTGASSKMTAGQYPNLSNSVEIKSAKIGKFTKMTLYSQPNFQGTAGIFYGNSDIINQDATCIDFTFGSAKVEKYPDALPVSSSSLTNDQLTKIWTNFGCNAESSVINDPKAITYWKNKLKTTAEVVADMKAWATDDDPTHKAGCYKAMTTADSPGEGEVVLFETCDYKGRYKKFGMGNIAFVGNDFNDITSSIKIGPYTSVTIYENANFGGKSATWKNDSNAVSVVNCLTDNNFDNMLSSLKVTSSTAQVSFNLDVRANPIFTLGPYYMFPWNLQNFIDKNAQWIWWNQWCGGSKGYQACNGSAPIDPKPIRFQLLIPVSTNREVPAIIHVIADNAPQGANFVKLNGKLIGQISDAGWATSNYSQIQAVLAPGNNLVEFDVQNTGGGAGLLVSVVNANTYEVIANSGTGQWSWIDPSKVVSSIMSEDVGAEFVIHDEKAKGSIVSFKNLDDIPKMTVGGTFRLTVNLKNVPPYIKGQQYKDGDTNQFYLSIEKLDPNCQVEDGNKCLNIFVDNKKCSNATLSNVSRTNSYRLALVSKAYVLDPEVPFGKNVDFTLVKVGDKLYLKNIQTGYMPKLFVNDYKQQLYGYMDTNYLSNITSLKSNENKICGSGAVATNETPAEESGTTIGGIFGKAMGGLFGTNQETGPRPDQKFVNCSTNADGSMYMMSSTNLAESNPVKFVLNKDGSVSIRLQSFNSYGNIDKTYSLIYCNFNVNTYAFIEKLTNPLGTFLINMLCFDPDDKRQLPNNTLNFNFEISKYPDSYLKEKNIYNLNA